MEIQCSQSNPPIGGVLAIDLVNSKNFPVSLSWGSENTVKFKSGEVKSFETQNDLLRILAHGVKGAQLYGATSMDGITVDHWLSFSLTLLHDLQEKLQYLDETLSPLTYLVSNKLTIADLAVFSILNGSPSYLGITKKLGMKNVPRWMRLIASQGCVVKGLASLPAEVKAQYSSSKSSDRSSVPKKTEGENGGRLQEGKFVDLPGAEMGKVIVRFPPEASGYLHIGHAKAALLNQYYQQAFQGKLIMRFDDTNPAKENVHFEKVILEDVEMLDIKPDIFTHTSQYFDMMLEMCERLIKEQKAFVDDTLPEQMKNEREQKVESVNRQNSVEKNLKLWEEMKKGSEVGVKCCVRAKIDMQSPNGCMRDPTIYRCKPEPHPRTGTQYKVYPTYDFACPIVDAVEDVTHVLRTMEYHDRDPQFYWFIEALGLRKPYIWEYSRLSMTNTVLSKRKLTWFVEEGLVDGWDDPRFPTVRGVLRRGMSVEGLKQFIIAQGSSRSVVFMEWDKIWAFNKKVIDPVAPRFTALEASPAPVRVNVINAGPEMALKVARHPKNPAVGEKTVWTGPVVLIDQADAQLLKEGENATFINWGNIKIQKIHKAADGTVTSVDAVTNLEDKDFKKTLKLTWLADAKATKFTPTYCVFFEHIISKGVLGRDEDFKKFIGHNTRTGVSMLGDPELAALKKGDVIQLQRRGFFKVDVAYRPPSELSGRDQPCVLFHIPDGHSKEHPTLQQSKQTNLAATPKGKATPVANGVAEAPKAAGSDIAEILEKIARQGDKIRLLKEQKADKAAVTAEVQTLLALKAEYKKVSGSDWTVNSSAPAAPVAASPASAPASTDNSADSILLKISAQGERIRQLKGEKADKKTIDPEVQTLLALKAEYKKVSGTDWTVNSKPSSDAVAPTSAPAVAPAPSSGGNAADSILLKIAAQGEKIRQLKGEKADKKTIDPEVQTLLALKAEYKKVSGTDWTVNSKPSSNAVAPTTPAVVPASGGNAADSILVKIAAQGEKIRQLKGEKADKKTIDPEVQTLLALKAEYKKVTGTDWTVNSKPSAAAVATPAAPAPSAPVTPSAPSGGGLADSILVQIAAQGEKVRQLKADKADKKAVESEVKVLLSLKADYKKATGTEWTPSATAKTTPAVAPAPVLAVCPAAAKPSAGGSAGDQVLEKIAKQGDRIRQLKGEKADKKTIDPEVQTLLALKAEYKQVTGADWTPNTKPSAPAPIPTMSAPAAAGASEADSVLLKISAQGDRIRQLKGEKADKKILDPEIQNLLALKAEYKKVVGVDWNPNIKPAGTASAPAPAPSKSPEKPQADAPKAVEQSPAVSALTVKINDQGNVVRDLKAAKAKKEDVDAAVKSLLELKAEYKKVAGSDFPVAGKGPRSSAPAAAQPKKEKSPPVKKEKKVEAPKEDGSGPKKQTRLGLEAAKETDLSDWYSQVITKGEMIEYYDVSGCYILRPWSYAVWDSIREYISKEIRGMGVKDCYFPIFVSKAALEREKDHIADFAPEVAWVTKSGDSDLAEHIAIRPTSETVMYPAYAKWIQSYRDLPMRLNQWNNVVRWEFQHPQPFLRSREFLWQEGHTAFATQEPADKEVLDILDLYSRVYTDLLAVPVVKGRKTEKEKFAGGDYTTTVEAFVPASGRGIQGATSHHLGQNFAKMFEIVFEDPDTQEKKYIFQNSWGLTTRTIGVMIMVHGDNQGLVLPPRVAALQAVLVPCGIGASTSPAEKKALMDSFQELEKALATAGVRVEGDYRDNYSPGWKFNHWELKGVPIRIELGPKDMAQQQLVAVRRDTGVKVTIKRDNAVKEIVQLLDTIQADMLAKATAERDAHMIQVDSWEKFNEALDGKNIIVAPYCGREVCEDAIKKESARTEEVETAEGAKLPAMGAKALCIPFQQPRALVMQDKCIHPACSEKPRFFTLFGRSY